MKQRLVLNFSSETVREPITYNLIKQYDVVINILNADVSHGKEGKLLIEMSGPERNVDDALSYLERKKVVVSPVIKTIRFNQDFCIHCGACVSVCYSEAITINRESRRIEFIPENCIACELCIKACPLQLYELNFGNN
ncbi:MAG: 4Fe-4S binding protein [Bacteroidales bacterium]|nr:4Fe-4S binding protein [Bacteroidales bacterium]MBN2697387.1 4Fe-4S binding protein [Bacteroidales bacterium]